MPRKRPDGCAITVAAGAHPDGVAIAFLVSAFPSPDRKRVDSISLQVHQLLPQANLIRIFCPGIAARLESGNSGDHPESTVNSLGQAIEICMSWEACRKRDRIARSFLKSAACDF